MSEVTCPVCGHKFESKSKTGETNCGNCLSRIRFDRKMLLEHRRRYYEKTREHHRAVKREYYLKNREKIRSYQKEHYDHEKAIEHVKAWKLSNPEKYREWRIKNKEWILQYRRQVRTRLKEERIKMLGGSCQICGYNKCLDALVFHHKDPNEKEREKDWANIRDFNSGNYVLLCANCHAEIHQNLREEQRQNVEVPSTPGQTLANNMTTA